MAIAVAQLAMKAGQIAEPIVIGFSIFIVGVVTSIMKLWPSLVPYDNGFRLILSTYYIVIVSGYNMGNPIKAAKDSFYSIGIGILVSVVVNTLIFPVWVGEQLHKELVSNFAYVADALEECVQKYLEDDDSEHPEFTNSVMDDYPNEPAYGKCRSTLNLAAKIETLANSTKWEPPFMLPPLGRF